jgi:hypothetical protein
MASRSASTILIILLILVPLAAVAKLEEFDRALCLNETLNMIKNKTVSPNNSSIFRFESDRPLSGPDNMTLTYDGCIEQCGPKRGFYKDIGPRLTTWLIPILLLISNVELSPLDKRRFMSIVHLLGDPIHSMWPFVLKAEA